MCVARFLIMFDMCGFMSVCNGIQILAMQMLMLKRRFRDFFNMANLSFFLSFLSIREKIMVK